ncbi:hypothetical protein ACLBW2_16915 [Enterobacteriaceae bacterium C23F]
MLSLTNTWSCDIWPHALRLRLGEQIVACHPREDEPLATGLAALLAQRKRALHWRDSVAFCLDTDDLAFGIQPWQPGITTPQELLKLAELLAIRERQGHWLTRFESATFCESALVARLKQTCWETLRTVAKQERLRFLGVTTPFQPLLRQYGKALPENGLFVTIGHQHSRIASRLNHAWHEVSTLALPRLEVRQQLRIVARLSGMADYPQYVINTDDGRPRVILPQENRL